MTDVPIARDQAVAWDGCPDHLMLPTHRLEHVPARECWWCLSSAGGDQGKADSPCTDGAHMIQLRVVHDPGRTRVLGVRPLGRSRERADRGERQRRSDLWARRERSTWVCTRIRRWRLSR